MSAVSKKVGKKIVIFTEISSQKSCKEFFFNKTSKAMPCDCELLNVVRFTLLFLRTKRNSLICSTSSVICGPMYDFCEILSQSSSS